MLFGHHTTHWPSCSYRHAVGMHSRLARKPDGRRRRAQNSCMNTNPVNTKVWHHNQTEKAEGASHASDRRQCTAVTLVAF